MFRPGTAVSVGKGSRPDHPVKIHAGLSIRFLSGHRVPVQRSCDHRQMRIRMKIRKHIVSLRHVSQQIVPVKQLCQLQNFFVLRHLPEGIQHIADPPEFIDRIYPGTSQNIVDFPVRQLLKPAIDVKPEIFCQPDRFFVFAVLSAADQTVQNLMQRVIRRPHPCIFLFFQSIQLLFFKRTQIPVFVCAGFHNLHNRIGFLL